MMWRKSTRSNSNPGACVEVARAGTMLVRDSKNPIGPRLAFSPQDWSVFVNGIRRGQLYR